MGYEVITFTEVASTPETLAKFYQTTWCYNSEDNHLHIQSLVTIFFLTNEFLNLTNAYSLFQKQCRQVLSHCRVQFFHANQWKLLLLDDQKLQSSGTKNSGVPNGEARLTAPSQMYAVLIKREITMMPPIIVKQLLFLPCFL